MAGGRLGAVLSGVLATAGRSWGGPEGAGSAPAVAGCSGRRGCLYPGIGAAAFCAGRPEMSEGPAGWLLVAAAGGFRRLLGASEFPVRGSRWPGGGGFPAAPRRVTRGAKSSDRLETASPGSLSHGNQVLPRYRPPGVRSGSRRCSRRRRLGVSSVAVRRVHVGLMTPK